MKYEIFVSKELSDILNANASTIGLTPSAYIVDELETLFANQLNQSTSYSKLYSELRTAVIDYKNSLQPGDTFTLPDIPHYQSLALNPAISSTLRARLGRSINSDITKKATDFGNIERVKTKNNSLAFKNGAALYRIK